MGAEAFNRGPEKDWGSDVKTKFGTLRSQQRNFSGSFCDDGRNTDYFLFSNWKKVSREHFTGPMVISSRPSRAFLSQKTKHSIKPEFNLSEKGHFVWVH